MEKKVVWKFGTGQPVPADGKYLSTQVETLEEPHIDRVTGAPGTLRKNLLVWHYYEMPLPRPESEKNHVE